MNTNAPAVPPSKLSIVYAGEAFDGSSPDRPRAVMLDGESLAVFVRAMPARHLGAVLSLALLEAELLDYVCMVIGPDGVREAVPQKWSDNLSDESHAQLYEAAKRQNFTRAAAWGERQIVAKQFSGELELKVEEAMMPILKKMSALLSSSPKSPALPAVATPKS